MPDPTDEDLRALLDGTLPPEEEKRLSELVATSPELHDRFSRLSGAAAFETDFATDVEPRESAPSPEITALIDGLKNRSSETPLSPVAPPQDLTVFLDLLEPTDDPVAKGRLGTYEIDDIIAVGGMGIVFKGRDPGLKRTVAIKLLSPSFAANPGARERFLREATSAAGIDHPNILPVHSVETGAKLPFIVMRYVDGPSLQDRLDALDSKPLPLDELLSIARALASALASAHDGGLIHRDVKPSNILLDETNIFLSDFGLARTVDDDLGLTQTGAFLGTPKFMSPEQAAGIKDLDYRSDLFSLGAVLYTMATGRPPFAGASFTTLANHVREGAPIAPRDLNPDLPAWLANLITRLLAKDPADRPPSAAKVAEIIAGKSDLGTLSLTRLLGQGTRRRRTAKRLSIAAAIAMLIASAPFLYREYRGGLAAREDARYEALANPTRTKPFVLAGETESYATLREAVGATTSGATVLIYANDLVDAGGALDIGPGRPLTLRAAHGYRPVIRSEATHPNAPIVRTRSPLRLEGLTLVQSFPSSDRPPVLIRAENAPLTLINCKFVRSTLQTRLLDKPEFALISLENAPALTLLNSEIYTTGSHVVLCDTSTSGLETAITFENSVVWGQPLWFRQSQPARAQVTINHCDLVANVILSIPPNEIPGQIAVTATHSIFNPRDAFVEQPWPDLATLKDHLLWSGDHNLFSVFGIFADFESGAPIATIDAWRAAFGSPDPTDLHSTFATKQLFERLPSSSDAFAATAPIRLSLPDDLSLAALESGADPALIGPGAHYHAFRQSAAYREGRGK